MFHGDELQLEEDDWTSNVTEFHWSTVSSMRK